MPLWIWTGFSFASGEVGAGQGRAFQVDTPEIGIRQVGAAKIGQRHVGHGQHAARQLGADKHAALQDGGRQVHAPQIMAAEVEATEIGAAARLAAAVHPGRMLRQQFRQFPSQLAERLRHDGADQLRRAGAACRP